MVVLGSCCVLISQHGERQPDWRGKQSLAVAKVFPSGVHSKPSGGQWKSRTISATDVGVAAKTVRRHVSRQRKGSGQDGGVQRTLSTTIRWSASGEATSVFFFGCKKLFLDEFVWGWIFVGTICFP